MINPLNLGEFEIYWLNGGEFELDGGTMFGAVPKVLWEKYYPSKDNYIKLINSPILIKTPEANVIIETGLGNKLTDKQKKIFRVSKDWDLPGDLKTLGIAQNDIAFVILTHCDFDHAGGVVMNVENNDPQLTFPKAKHVVQKQEWQDATNPNRRSANTYWDHNLSSLQGSENLMLVKGRSKICKGIEVLHTGGHTRGHQIVKITSGSESAYHLADLLPTHVHFNPLWIMAYDNYPLDVVEQKEKLEEQAIKENAWFTYYHDPFLRACKFDENGKIISQFPSQ